MGANTPPGSLHGLLKAKREALVSSWRKMIKATVSAGSLPVPELLARVPALVDEVIDVLGSDLPDRLATTGTRTGRLRSGFDISQVVLEYGLVHGCILRIAEEESLALTYHDQRVLAGWISIAITDALAEYVERRDAEPRRRRLPPKLGSVPRGVRRTRPARPGIPPAIPDRASRSR